MVESPPRKLPFYTVCNFKENVMSCLTFRCSIWGLMFVFQSIIRSRQAHILVPNIVFIRKD